MNNKLISEIENVFRISNSSDKLFDYFQCAIVNKIDDLNLYKILLANPVLNAEEIALFSDKLADIFPHLRYEIYLWSAGILENARYCAASLEKAFEYYLSAMHLRPDSAIPLLSLMNMHNSELDFPPASEIITQVEKASEKVTDRGRIFLSLAEFCKKIKKPDIAKRYEERAYIEQKRERKNRDQ